MPTPIIEQGWSRGWIPSSDDKAPLGASGTGLLAMQNLTLDAKGVVRKANTPTVESIALPYKVNSIGANLVAGRKLRYVYTDAGALKRNYGGTALQNTYDLSIFTGSGAAKAAFLSTLGHTLIAAGTKRYKDDGTLQWPLGIPAPVAPTLTNNALSSINLSNLDGGGNYTNWTNVQSSAFNNAGTNVGFTPDVAHYLGITRTIYAANIDTTNFGGGTGKDTVDDLISFDIQVDVPTAINLINLELFCIDPTAAGGATDEYYTTIEYQTTVTSANAVTLPDSLGVNTGVSQTYQIHKAPFTLSPNIKYTVITARNAFVRTGTSAALNWSTIKAASFSVAAFATVAVQFSNLRVGSAAVTGLQKYIAVEVNDTGQYLEYSVSSVPVSVTASLNYVTVDRSGTPVNAQANSIRYFRNNTVLGEYLEVRRETGARGFTPASFVDSLNDQDTLAAAAIDPSKVLQYYRATLPDNIVGMIYFAGRVIYLTTASFFPSYQLDPGSYDSRYVYELTGTQGEVCYFIAKLDVGTFVVATSKDFYRVTGTFALISYTNADGTTTVVQDVNIIPLGITDPAINRSFIEIDGSIMYVSSTGIRTFTNGSSSLLNGELDLLFRGENRYGYRPITLHPNDVDFIGCATSGNRVYWSLPDSQGKNYVFVNTFNPAAKNDLRGDTYWRPLTDVDPLDNPSCLLREDDGTLLYGSRNTTNINYVRSLDNGFSTSSVVRFQTQFNYGDSPNPKELGVLRMLIDTGNAALVGSVTGILEAGGQVTSTFNVQANGLTLLEIDVSSLGFCLAFSLQFNGTTSVLSIEYFNLEIVQEIPGISYYAVVLPSELGVAARKRLGSWPFQADPLGNPLTIQCTVDGAADTVQSIGTSGITTNFWKNFNHLIGLDWKLEVRSALGMRFFKFEAPDVIEKFPFKTYYAISPYTNYGVTNPKKIAVLPFMANTFGSTVTATVSVDGAVITAQTFSSTYIQTLNWLNVADLLGTDWQIEVVAPSGMEFYGFGKPVMLQIFPNGKLLDQLGPFDLDQKGLVFGMRFRAYGLSTPIHYQVYDADVLVYEGDLAVTLNKDQAYLETFPKGINPSVCRILFSAANIFYRFSFEIKVRTTGKQTEEQWIAIK